MGALQVIELDSLSREDNGGPHSPEEKAQLGNKILDKARAQGLPVKDFLVYLNPESHPASEG